MDYHWSNKMGIFWVSLIDLKFDLITYAKAKFAF